MPFKLLDHVDGFCVTEIKFSASLCRFIHNFDACCTFILQIDRQIASNSCNSKLLHMAQSIGSIFKNFITVHAPDHVEYSSVM